MDTIMFMLIGIGTAVGMLALRSELVARNRNNRSPVWDRGLTDNQACVDPQTALQDLRAANDRKLSTSPRSKHCSRRAA